MTAKRKSAAARIASRAERSLERVLIDAALSGSGALPALLSDPRGCAAAVRRLSLWTQGFEPSEDGKSQRRKPKAPCFTKSEKTAGRADRLYFEMARHGRVDGVAAHSDTLHRRWSFLSFEHEKTIVVLDRKQEPKTREGNGEAAAERQWISEGFKVWHVPAVECDTPARLRFLARWLAIVLGRALLPWEEAAAAAATVKDQAEQEALEAMRKKQEAAQQKVRDGAYELLRASRNDHVAHQAVAQLAGPEHEHGIGRDDRLRLVADECAKAIGSGDYCARECVALHRRIVDIATLAGWPDLAEEHRAAAGDYLTPSNADRAAHDAVAMLAPLDECDRAAGVLREAVYAARNVQTAIEATDAYAARSKLDPAGHLRIVAFGFFNDAWMLRSSDEHRGERQSLQRRAEHLDEQAAQLGASPRAYVSVAVDCDRCHACPLAPRLERHWPTRPTSSTPLPVCGRSPRRAAVRLVRCAPAGNNREPEHTATPEPACDRRATPEPGSTCWPMVARTDRRTDRAYLSSAPTFTMKPGHTSGLSDREWRGLWSRGAFGPPVPSAEQLEREAQEEQAAIVQSREREARRIARAAGVLPAVCQSEARPVLRLVPST
jgi:hypothetical protein